MPTGVELANAWVRLVPSFEGVQGEIAKALAPAQGEADKAGKASGQRFGGAMAGAVAGLVAPLAASALAGIKNLVGEMAQQVDSTKKFRSTLEFADVSDANIKRLTKSTQAYADKTVYSLSDIRNITAQLASNGVKDFDKLAEAGGNLNAIAGGNAETFKSVGMVITQTAGQGKLTTENWNQLSDAIPGAAGKLMGALKEAGAYTGNFRDAMAKGEITSEEFNKALLELGTQPVAVKAAQSTTTFEGALGNLQAGIVKAGAAILERLAPAFSVVAGKVAEFASSLTGVVDWIANNMGWIAPLAIGLGTLAAGYTALNMAATIAATGGLKAWLLQTKIATGVQAAFNLVLNANPLSLIVIAIAAVVAALVYFFTQTKLGKEVWANLTAWISDAWGAITRATTWAWEKIIQPVFQAIGKIVTWIWQNIISPYVNLIINIIRIWAAIIQWLWTNAIQPVLNWVGGAFTNVWNKYISPIIGWIVDKVKVMGLGFQILYTSYVKPAWDSVQSALSAGWSWINRYVFSPFKSGIDLLGQAFENGQKAIGTAWDKIKGAAARPINFVLDTVWNNGLRSFWNGVMDGLNLKDLKLPSAKTIKYASGGVLPGYTPGRDVHEFYSPTGGRLSLSGGEAIMRPEFTRAVGGPAGVARLNRQARSGGIGHAFAGGGVIDWLGHVAGDVWDNVKNVAGAVGEFVSNPGKAVQKHIIDGIINPLVSGGGGGVWLKAAAALPVKMVKALLPRLTAPAGTGKGTKGMGWSKMWDMIHAAYPGLVMTSNYRSPGANAAVGGAKGSYHTLGRALDLIPASMDTFNKIAKMFPNASELIYTPAGSRQLRNGQPFAGWSAAVRAMHYNHIHLAMKNGGVLPGLARGGTVTGAGATVVGENGPELLRLPKGAQVNPDFDDIEDGRPVVFNNYAPLGKSPAQALTEFSNRAKGM